MERCKAMAFSDLHYGFSLCHVHIAKDLVQKCSHCKRLKLMTRQYMRGGSEETGLCMDCSQPCSIHGCERPARSVVDGSPLCDWHKNRIGPGARCAKKANIPPAGSRASASGATSARSVAFSVIALQKRIQWHRHPACPMILNQGMTLVAQIPARQ